MKILCLEEPGKLRIREEAKPQLQDGHVLVKMELCGICGSDVNAYRGINPTMKYPINGLGHEGVGIVQAVADNVKNIKPGDRVVLEPYVPCGQCYMCKQMRYNNCVRLKLCGVHKDGMMAEYFLHPASLCHKIPADLSFSYAVLAEPFTIGLHAASRAEITKGERCVIFGAGVIGLMTAFACINYGAVPILVDILPERVDYARRLGISYVFCSAQGDVEAYLKEITDGKLPEKMIDCTGSQTVLSKMQDYVSYGGKITLVGWPSKPVTINTIRLTQKEIDIIPSRNSNKKFGEAIQLIYTNKLPAKALITKTITLEEVEDTIKAMIQSPAQYLRVLVTV